MSVNISDAPFSSWPGYRAPWTLVGGLLAVAAVLELIERLFSDYMTPSFRAGYALSYGLLIAAWFILLMLRVPLPRVYWYSVGVLVVLLLAVYASLLAGVPERIGEYLGGDSGAYAGRLWIDVTGWLIGVGLAGALTLAVYELEQFNRVVQRQADALRESRDSLEQRVAERTQALGESEARFRTLTDALPDVVTRYDRRGRRLYVNRAVEALMGIPREEYLGKTNEELGHPAELVKIWEERLREVFQSGERSEMSFRFSSGSGEREFHSVIVPEWSESGRVEHIVAVTRDITDLRQVERQVGLLARIARETRDIVVLTDAAGCVEWVNEGFTRVTEYTLEEVVGRKLGRVLRGPDTDPGTAAALSAAVRSKQGFYGKILNYTKSGRPFWMEITIQLLPAADGEPTRFMSVQRDITQRIRNEQALAESEGRYRLLAESSPDAIYIIDTDGQFHFVNEVMARNLGRPVEEIIGTNERELNPPPVAERHLASVRLASMSDSPVQVEEPVPVLGGQRWFQIILTRLPGGEDGAVKVMGIARDITEQREAERTRAAIEERVRQAQKLESMALLAGGVAHDFNNLLMAVLGNASLLREEFPADTPGHEMARDIMVSAERAAELSRQMLAFSGHGRMVSLHTNLSEAVEGMRGLVEASSGHRAPVSYALLDDLPIVDADPGQLKQAVLNLVTNAAEAVEERLQPSITIRTGVQQCDHAFLSEHFAGQELPEGAYVYIEVEDNGLGVSPEHVDRIFEPFFTTKFTGRGLGLSAVQGIMRGHQGTVAVRSTPGEGTAVRLLFPVVEELETIGEDVMDFDVAWQGTGRVLVADDEASVRRTMRRMLERLGFEVVTASDGLQALRVCDEYEGGFACVFLDTMMPSLDGAGALRELRLHYPVLPVVVISGYSPDYVRERFAEHGIAGVLQKPFRAQALVEALRDVLEARA